MISKYRSRVIADNVIAFSISYQRDNLLARGMGLEHLRELLVRLARPVLRQGASLSYAGYWEDAEDNFTYDLLRLIHAEQEDNRLSEQGTSLQIGQLYIHSAWPHYLRITPRIEAQWVNCCRIVRITQMQAGLTGAEVVCDGDAFKEDARSAFNAAVTLSAMRRLMMHEMYIDIPDVPMKERIPAVVARILLGGKLSDYSGFMPGIFEEALVTLREHRPLYILGGFGGAAEVLCRSVMAGGSDRPAELTLAWHEQQNAGLTRLLAASRQFPLPSPLNSIERSLDELYGFVLQARSNLSATLNAGLSDQETRNLLTTRDIATAAHLVRTGLMNNNKLPLLAA